MLCIEKGAAQRVAEILRGPRKESTVNCVILIMMALLVRRNGSLGRRRRKLVGSPHNDDSSVRYRMLSRTVQCIAQYNAHEYTDIHAWVSMH